MAKHLDPKISGLSFDKEDHPGCLWGVVHVLRFYQWNNVKKMMPSKKSGSRRPAASLRFSRLRSNNLDASESQGLLDTDADDMNMRKSQGNMPSLPTFRSYFTRTDSIHHLDPSSHMLPDEVREVARCNSSGRKNSSLPPSCCNNGEKSPMDVAGCQSEIILDNLGMVELKKRSFKDIKRKIKNAIKETRKEGHRISMDAIFHKVPYGNRFSKGDKSEMANNSELISNKGGINNIRRTQSLNESLNRYSQLLELSDGRDPKQLYSRSLKLANESGASKSFGSSTPKALGRLLSLPNLDPYQCDEPRDDLALGSPIRVPVDRITSLNKDQMELISDQEIGSDHNAGDMNQPRPSPISVLEVEKKDEADFNYVKDVLKLSGFIGHRSLGTWYSPEQPVDPSLSSYSGDGANSSYDHKLLFDMINEVLVEIYDRSFTYWPLALSSNCHIRPVPLGRYVLEEVWGIISWYLNSQPEFEPFDYLVVRDLSKNDGWMNIQVDSESVGIELEEMIFDDLLDEMLYE